jgi:hypothetical protein
LFDVGSGDDRAEARPDPGWLASQKVAFYAPLVLAVASGAWIEPVAAVVIALTLFPSAFVYQRALRLQVSPQEVCIRRLGRDLRVERHKINRVAVVLFKESTRVDRSALLLDESGECLGKLTQSQWGRATLESVVALLDVPVDRRDELPLSIAKVRREFPKSFSWVRAHTTLTVLLVVPPATAVFVGVALLTGPGL